MPEFAVTNYKYIVNRKIERVLLDKNINILEKISFPTKAVGFCPIMSFNLAAMSMPGNAVTEWQY